MTRKSSIATKLDKLAERILDDTLDDGVSLEERVDVLKVVGAYHLGIARQSAKDPKADDESDNGRHFGAGGWGGRLKKVGSIADA